MSDHSSDPGAAQLAYTGERMMPGDSDPATFWEHIYRYRFATRFVPGQRVLDIACGEGYGSAALRQAGAVSVVGVDVSPQACEHARRTYGIDARVGDATAIPLPNQSIDIIVSFETIEHVAQPTEFINECARVLAPGGVLIISTPNRNRFRADDIENPFHCSEMSRDEFVTLLRSRFPQITLFSQDPQYARWWSLRGLATAYWRHDSWFWWRLRLMRHLRWRASRTLTPHLEGEVSTRFRQNPLDAIFLPTQALSDLFNRCAIRRSSWHGGDEPAYFLTITRT